MSLFHIFVLLTLSLVFILAVIMTFYYKGKLRHMSEMVLSMGIGTNVGLTVGLLIGAIYQGNLFYSTVYSILVGILAGSIYGFIFGILPSIEGSMAGLMGGMMGAMLGEMVPKEQSFILINLFLTLSVSTLFLFPILSVSTEKGTHRQTRQWLFKPLLTFIFFTTYLLFGSQVDKKVIFSKSSPSAQGGHLNNQSELSKDTEQFEFTINVQPSQYSYDPAKIVLEKGRSISLILQNNDFIEHDIEIKNIPIENINTGTHDEHATGSEDFHLHASAQEQTKLTFTPVQEGSYEFYCTIPGHKEKGMIGLLVVT